eukprot:6386097-Pyramimonas_sp.AAC.1
MATSTKHIINKRVNKLTDPTKKATKQKTNTNVNANGKNTDHVNNSRSSIIPATKTTIHTAKGRAHSSNTTKTNNTNTNATNNVTNN